MQSIRGRPRCAWKPHGILPASAPSRHGDHYMTEPANAPLLPKRIEFASEVLFQELKGEAVLLDLKAERYYGLDDIAMRMWQLVSESGDVMAARARLLEEFEVEPEILDRDLASQIAQWVEAGLVSPVEPVRVPSSTESTSA